MYFLEHHYVRKNEKHCLKLFGRRVLTFYMFKISIL